MNVEIKILIVLAVILCLCVVMLFLIRYVIKECRRTTRDSIVAQINSFDKLIDEKNIHLAGIAAQIEELDRILEKKSAMEQAHEEDVKQVSFTKQVRYCRDDYMHDYRNIKEKFHFDKQKLLEVAREIQTSQGSDELYRLTNDILQKLNLQTVYKIITFRSEEQLEILSVLLNERENEFLGDYLKQGGTFRCEKFWYYLKCVREQNDSSVVVAAADNAAEYLGAYLMQGLPTGYNITTLCDLELCEGFQVRSSTKLYDYGIRRNELS